MPVRALRQHDIWIVYGDSSYTAPSTNDDYKPIFDLDSSTNDSWVFADFGENLKPRPGSWYWVFDYGAGVDQYTATQDTDASTWSVLGIKSDIWSSQNRGTLWFTHPAGMTAVNFTNGYQKAATDLDAWEGIINDSTHKGATACTETAKKPPGSFIS